MHGNSNIKKEIVCLPSECGNENLSPFYKPAFDILLGRHDKKWTFL